MPPFSTLNLHPNTHSLSSLPTKTYDVICIGSGWAPRVLSARLVAAGLSALIIESELIGGECPFWACIPSKALLRSAEALSEARGVSGLTSSSAVAEKLDAGAVFARRDAFTANWDDGAVLVPMVEGSGTTLVRGKGRVSGVRRVSVEDREGGTVEVEARLAVAVCTGSVATVPDVPGLVESDPWGPRQVTSASEVPAHLVVLGAGAVGVEMVTAYASFGSRVTLVARSEGLLPRFDPEAGEVLREAFEKRGVDVRTGVEPVAVRPSGEGAFTVELSKGASIEGVTKILAATGRKPVTQDIGLETVGLAVRDGAAIPVDESLLVPSVPGEWLYALGDVNMRGPFSHSSKYHGRIAANAILARAKGDKAGFDSAWSPVSATADSAALPQVVFSSPQLASVGLTRTAAKAAGRAIREVTAPVWTLGAKLRADEYEKGWSQWIVDAKDDKLLGATFVGDNVAELLHASTVAIVGGLTLQQLAHAVPPFPTMSEVYLNLQEAAGL